MLKKNKVCKNLWVLFFLILFTASNTFAVYTRNDNAPSLLSYAELASLYENDLSTPLESKLNSLLTNPFVDNSNSNSEPYEFSIDAELGEHIRVVHWNIECGLNYEQIESAFTNLSLFVSMLDKENHHLMLIDLTLEEPTIGLKP